MKLTIELLNDILESKPVKVDEFACKDVFSLLGFRVIEYYKASLSPYVSYEVHYRRYFVCEVSIDDSRALSVRNKYMELGGDCDGVCFGGIDTFKQLLQTVILIVAPRTRVGYEGEVNFDADDSEYTEEEFRQLIEVLNESLFSNAQ